MGKRIDALTGSVLAFAICIAAETFGAETPALKYNFAPDQEYVYDISIGAETLEVFERLYGESRYKVFKTDPKAGLTTLVHNASLTQQRSQKGKSIGPPPWPTGIILDYNRP